MGSSSSVCQRLIQRMEKLFSSVSLIWTNYYAVEGKYGIVENKIRVMKDRVLHKATASSLVHVGEEASSLFGKWYMLSEENAVPNIG